MCGIVGKFNFETGVHVSKDELIRMGRTLVHRGPDGEGVWIKGNIGLAHRRLAVIDLRPEAAQPMCNEDGTIWITFNGEIYNFRELRQQLEACGHTFRSKSDTESVIHAYEEYGKDCVKYLRGMFAFAIWDGPHRSLFLARDRVGKKPLYYYADKTKFVFASEIKAILKDPTIAATPNHQALDHLLTWQHVPSPESAFEGIKKLPAAHWMEISDRQMHIQRYWTLHYSPKRKISFGDAVTELKERIDEAVRVRLESDVPLGAFLSGGIDSSAIVAYMARAMDQPVLTFSAGFKDEAFDERPFAKLVADKYGTNHTELLVDAPVADVLPKLVWHYDEPFGDSSAVPSYAIAGLTKQYVTVVLNGDGGDENFAGYGRYVRNYYSRFGDMIPGWMYGGIGKGLQWLPAGFKRSHSVLKLKSVVDTMKLNPDLRYAKWLTHFSPNERQWLYSKEFRETLETHDPESLLVKLYAQSDATNWIDATLNVDVELYLTDDLLVKMDRATMAHSLEARSPFLDHHLMEYVASLPASYKLRYTDKKRILKAALRETLPDSILDRPKMGFGVPLAKWFREDLREMAYDILLSKSALERGYFQPKRVETLLSRHCHGLEDNAEGLWDLLNLELWHRTFIDAGCEEPSFHRSNTTVHKAVNN